MYTVVRQGETLARISARTGVPACMLMRANGLFSAAWLLPGREIIIPETAYCRGSSDGICPARACTLGAWKADSRKVSYDVSAAEGNDGLPVRLRILARTQDLRLPYVCRSLRVRYGETWASLAEKTASEETELMRINRIWRPLLPGMQIAVRKNDDR